MSYHSCQESSIELLVDEALVECGFDERRVVVIAEEIGESRVGLDLVHDVAEYLVDDLLREGVHLREQRGWIGGDVAEVEDSVQYLVEYAVCCCEDGE